MTKQVRLYTVAGLRRAVLAALLAQCYCDRRISMCVPCTMVSRVKAGERLSEIIAEYLEAK